MVRSRKRITRKAIRQPDQFFTITSRVFRFFEVYRTRILLILALVIAFSLGLGGWKIYHSKQNRLASQAYSRALAVYHDGRYQEALELLDRVNTYRSPNYHRLAILYRAYSYLGLKQPKEAVRSLQEFLNDTPKNLYLRQLALLNLGFAHEMDNQCNAAISAFTEAAKIDGARQDEAILSKARCTTAIGQLTESVKIYRDYLASYPASASALEISLRIQELEARMKGDSGDEKG